MSKNKIIATSVLALGLILTVFANNFTNNSIWDYFHRMSVINNAPDFAKITDVEQMKTAFFEYLAPVINEQNQKILQLRNKIKNNKISDFDLQRLAKKYRTSVDNLLKSIDIIPVSLALSQAAVESNWGRSRFANFNNYYGIWCFVKGCGVVPNARDNGATHEVAKFYTIGEATRKYIFNLNSHSAYKGLREIRQKLRQENKKISGIELALGLEKYSGIGHKYIETLQKMIKYNKLETYPHN